MFKQRATSDFEGPKRSLTAADYSMIRGATGYLFSRFEDLKNHSDFDSFMQRYQMDSRFWGAQSAAQSAGRQLGHIELSAQELAHLLASAQTKPTHCEFDSSLKATKRCQVRIDRVETSNSNPQPLKPVHSPHPNRQR